MASYMNLDVNALGRLGLKLNGLSCFGKIFENDAGVADASFA